MELILLPDRLAICRLPQNAPIPQWATAGDFYAIGRTPEELTVVCPDGHPPPGTEVESGWRALQVAGPLDFEAVGILSSLTAPLAEAGIPVFVNSAFSTDYILIKEKNLSKAIRVLGAAHTIHT